MANISRKIYLQDRLPNHFDLSQLTSHIEQAGIVMEIWPHEEQTQLVYMTLKSLAQNDYNVYLKHEMPVRWHFKNNSRVPPVLLVASDGKHVWINKHDDPLTGDHGYDNQLDSMKPAFMARGPAFKEGVGFEESIGLENVYSLICHLLNIEPGKSDGSLLPFLKYLK